MTPYIIVALAYVVFSAPTPLVLEPIRFDSKQSFKDIETCQGFLKSAEFQDWRSQLYEQVSKATAETKDIDDVVSDIAITASCEEDNSL